MRLAQKLALKYIRTKFKLLSSISKRKAAEKAFELFCTPQNRSLKTLPKIFENAEKLEFRLENYKITGYRWNHPSQKKALILHGFESSVVNFDRYVKPLLAKGYEVLAFDAPAHGFSSGKTVTVITYKKMVQHIIKHYGPVNSFIAHSFGGLTLSLVLDELPHDESLRVVLVAPATETTTAIDNFFHLVKLDKEVRKEFDNLITEMGQKPPSWYSVARVAPDLKARVLFLQDKKDKQTPFKDVKPIMDKKLPNFQFIISDGLGHSRIYREAETVKTIIDFL